ncbi:MAG: CBS domain-containing protein [Nitrososphaerota archaeon]
MYQLRLRDLIRRRPITVESGATVHDVIKIMARENVGFLIVK